MSNFWKEIKEPWKCAFPIAEVYENGDAIITKAPGTGRMVTEWTVKEHLVYEVHDPKRYLMADGIADLTGLKVKEIAKRKVVILPVLLEDCRVPALLRDKKSADCRTSFGNGIREILAALETHEKRG